MTGGEAEQGHVQLECKSKTGRVTPTWRLFTKKGDKKGLIDRLIDCVKTRVRFVVVTCIK